MMSILRAPKSKGVESALDRTNRGPGCFGNYGHKVKRVRYRRK